MSSAAAEQLPPIEPQGPVHPALRFSERPALDWKTALLVIPEWGLVALAALGHLQGWLGPVGTVLLSMLGLNLAFTVWHEGVHGSVARDRRLNDIIGRLGAIPVFVLYDRFVRHHLLHHRYTNDPERDPDFWQVNGPFWTLGLRFFAGDRRAREICSAASEDGSVSSTADHIQIGLSFFALVTFLWLAPATALLAVVIPRVALTYVHSFYVNYVPHVNRPAGRVAAARLIRTGPLQSWLMMRHNLHALHHAYPSIPWHHYRDAHAEIEAELVEKGVETTTLAESLSLLGGPTKEAT